MTKPYVIVSYVRLGRYNKMSEPSYVIPCILSNNYVTESIPSCDLY